MNTSGTGVSFGGQQLFLQILQTLPSLGTATVVGSLSGTIIDGSQSTAMINWKQPSRFATIGNATYEVERSGQEPTPINAASSGPQTIRGFVTLTLRSPRHCCSSAPACSTSSASRVDAGWSSRRSWCSELASSVAAGPHPATAQP